MLQFSAAMYPVGKMSVRNRTCSSRRADRDLERTDIRVRNSDELGLPAGVAAHHVRVAEQRTGWIAVQLSVIDLFGLELSQDAHSSFRQK